MRYLDTGSRDAGDTLYNWIAQALEDATYFGCQVGYFNYDGIFPLESSFLSLLNRSGEIRLVVGANESSLRSVDLEDVLSLFEKAPPTSISSLTVVAADDVLMHPKTYYVEKVDGSQHALVGSANLTHPGLSRNIEASLAINSIDDPAAPFQNIRAAIDSWHLQSNPNARSVTRLSLAQLVADGILDQPGSSPRPLSLQSRRNRAKAFPGLGSIVRLPRKPRSAVRAIPVSLMESTAAPLVGTPGNLPSGRIGIVKELSSLDVKGFNGGTGTLYIALPSVMATHLSMTPFGKNREPRMDVTVEARLDTVPGEVVLSGDSPTNITHVGTGFPQSSHRDLRFNYLSTIRRGIAELAADNGVAVPAPSDLVAIEMLAEASVRVTFITDPSSKNALRPLLDSPDSSWGWLPPSWVVGWDGRDGT